MRRSRKSKGTIVSDREISTITNDNVIRVLIRLAKAKLIQISGHMIGGREIHKPIGAEGRIEGCMIGSWHLDHNLFSFVALAGYVAGLVTKLTNCIWSVGCSIKRPVSI